MGSAAYKQNGRGLQRAGGPRILRGMSALDIAATVDMFATLAVEAGAAIMRVRAGDPQARLKADRSPVTDADEAAERIILRGLAGARPHIPVVSEEAASRGEAPAIGPAFILVDPLDGTREFLAGNGEFTVNIALIVEGAPVGGVVYAPALGLLWRGAAARAARCDVLNHAPPSPQGWRPIRTRPRPTALVALVSRSHPDAQSQAFLARLPVAERRCAGSSLKFCQIAEGLGDVYPRGGSIMQWDVAAGDAVLRAAGGLVVDEAGAPLRYGPAGGAHRVGPFVAWGDAEAARTALTIA